MKMVMARRKNWSIYHTWKTNRYLWALALLEHVVGDGESTLPILHLDDVLEAELDRVTGEVVLGYAEAILPLLRVLVHQLRAVLQRLDPPDEPAHGQVQSGQTCLYGPLY